jgi:hypothetical protein
MKEKFRNNLFFPGPTQNFMHHVTSFPSIKKLNWKTKSKIFNRKNRRIFYAIQLISISCDLQKDIADLLQEIHQGNQLPKRHRRPPARDTPRQSTSKKPRKVNASEPDRCNEANTRSSSAPGALSTQTALEVTSQSSASEPQQHLSISHGPVVNIVSDVQSYRPGNQERSQSIGTTSSTPLNPQSSSSGNPPPQSR